jgi:hypothetical protein
VLKTASAAIIYAVIGALLGAGRLYVIFLFIEILM